nr:50S ribosomal protein L18-like [Ipomoea batatas]
MESRRPQQPQPAGGYRRGEPEKGDLPIKMVIPPPVRPERVTKFLKPYVLRMHFTNKYVNAQVVHTPTATVAAAASTQEKGLRLGMIEAKENTRDVDAAAKIGKLLGERLRVKGVPAVSIFFKRDQRYHGKVKAVIDSIRGEGIELV